MKIEIKDCGKFLPLKKFHQVPILGIEPSKIKESVTLALKERQLLMDREDISKNTLLNCLCKSLGFSGGFASYKDSYPSGLKVFMEENNLVKYKNLVSCQGLDPLAKFDYQQVSDRLFHQSAQKLPRPKKIFTGHNVNHSHLLELALFDNSVKFEYAPTLPESFGFPESYEEELKNPDYILTLKKMEKCERIRTFDHGDPVLTYKLTYKGERLRFISFSAFNNLISTHYLDLETKDEHEFLALYYNSETIKEDVIKCDLINYLLSQSEAGWLDIIPFNKNLIFLRGSDGQYDFVFRNLRNSSFNHNIYNPYLENQDTPKTYSEYDFQRWLYFPCNYSDSRSPYNGWKEYDLHRAEIDFYENGGTGTTYPTNNLLKNYLIKTEAYQPLSETAPLSEGYIEVKINNIRYAISALITINEFEQFMLASSNYSRGRNNQDDVDSLSSVNREDNKDLPVTVTWHDAMAYVAWISKKDKLPVRLLNFSEYKNISSEFIPPKRDLKNTSKKPIPKSIEEKTFQRPPRISHFYESDGKKIENHPPYMKEKKFQELIFKFDENNLPWKESNGLNFINSCYFGEWLIGQGQAIDCFHGTAIHSTYYNPEKEPFLPTSTGKYKSKKIGFRMIYKIS